MRLSPVTTLVGAVALVATAVPSGAAVAEPGQQPAPRPDHPAHPVLGDSTSAADQALSAVRAAFAKKGEDHARAGVGVGGRELTTDLLQLRLGLDELSPEDQQVARAYLARPTDGTEYYGANYSRKAHPTHDCRPALATPDSNVCVHWARKTADAPRMNDADGDGIPNFVEKTRDTMNLVWSRIVDSGGYTAPLPDTKGPDTKLDVYLVDIGDAGLYGYCGSENIGKGRAAAAYCVLDDDYARRQFPLHTPLQNLQVTAAHEFFHAVQFAYDVREDPWLMESTSTWIEDEIFDKVNDNRGYLNASVARVPERPLDSTYPYYYGDWIWWRYLTEHYPADQGTGLPVLVRDVWEAARDAQYVGTYSMDALDRVLLDRHRALAEVLAQFGADNRIPGRSYEEGKAYRRARLGERYRLTADKQKVGTQSTRLAHMSNTTVAFKPDDSYDAAGWTLTLDVDLPGSKHEPYAQANVFHTDGSVTREFVVLAGNGVGTLQVPFSSSTVRRVELTLTNGDHSYDCREGTRWSCRGIPDKKRTFEYAAHATLP